MTRAAHKGGWGKCTTCAHPDRLAVEAAIDSGQPIGTVAKVYGLSRSALHRHLDRHRSGALVRVHPAQVIRAGIDAGISDDAIASELATLLLTAKSQLETAGSTTQTLTAIDQVLKVVVASGAWQERILARKRSAVVTLGDVPGYRDFTVAMERALLAHDAKYHQHLSTEWAPGAPPSLVTKDAESARRAVLDVIEHLNRTQGD